MRLKKTSARQVMDAAIIERKATDKPAEARPTVDSKPRWFRGALIKPRKE